MKMKFQEYIDTLKYHNADAYNVARHQIREKKKAQVLKLLGNGPMTGAEIRSKLDVDVSPSVLASYVFELKRDGKIKALPKRYELI